MISFLIRLLSTDQQQQQQQQSLDQFFFSTYLMYIEKTLLSSNLNFHFSIDRNNFPVYTPLS